MKALTASTGYAAMRGPSATGEGALPALTIAYQVDRLTGMALPGPTKSFSRKNPLLENLLRLASKTDDSLMLHLTGVDLP
ncbi:hypothetical protein ACU4I5_20280 [Ensifer adhaerens]